MKIEILFFVKKKKICFHSPTIQSVCGKMGILLYVNYGFNWNAFEQRVYRVTIHRARGNPLLSSYYYRIRCGSASESLKGSSWSMMPNGKLTCFAPPFLSALIFNARLIICWDVVYICVYTYIRTFRNPSYKFVYCIYTLRWQNDKHGQNWNFSLYTRVLLYSLRQYSEFQSRTFAISVTKIRVFYLYSWRVCFMCLK